jgi:hypothetical protein
MYTATVPIALITPDKFLPYTPTGKNMSATFGLPVDTSAAPGSTITAPKSNSLQVSVPGDYMGGFQITFQLPQPDYVLLGISVNPITLKSGATSVGRQEFRTIAINRDSWGSQLTVTDACIRGFGGIDFHYLLLVQQVSDGQIGAIDPDIDSEPGE